MEEGCPRDSIGQGNLNGSLVRVRGGFYSMVGDQSSSLPYPKYEQSEPIRYQDIDRVQELEVVSGIPR